MTGIVTSPRPSAPAQDKERRLAAAERRAKRRRAYERPGALTYALLIAFFAGSAFPLWWSFVIGSRQSSDVNLVPPAIVPGGNFLTNVDKVFDTVPFWLALANSIVISGAITVSVVFFSTLAGYSFAKLRFRGRTGLLLAVIATMAIPTQLGIIPLFMLMGEWGWIGTVQAVIVPGMVTAFGVFFMRQYLVDVIPDELIEAARVDGASMWGTFWHVALPAARPAMAVLALFTFMASWTDYLWPQLVLSPRNPNVQTALAALSAAGGQNPDNAMVLAGAVLSVIPLLILFFAAGKQLVAGIMQGAVKG
ncbi:carbohydrate ABC transporter permease [Microbacterium caowuchunii]|uniref:carbohydrate ABC transporter permease n=1 Tax=Microbacterium caowuchunii TaxID=2614638 RepID=UPI001247F8BE|nr:carbohydrate ABC transporter permease [Microbacterium caowuchunii]QEV98910.1 carbohydrate ABC transporter permease [Microbacterium caowuchunii]